MPSVTTRIAARACGIDFGTSNSTAGWSRPGHGLLLTLEYPQAERAGPPFSVPPDEVFRHFADVSSIEHWSDDYVLPEHPHWQARGISYLREHVFALTWHR